jgi:uncharacterized repeat protein (TIGR01451 family)
VQPGQTVTLTVVVRVNPGTENTIHVNRFQVSRPGGGPPPVVEEPCADRPGFSCATTDTPGVPKLTQAKTVDAQTATVGDRLTYTITIANHGTGDATGVIAHDRSPAGVTFVSADTHGHGTFDRFSNLWGIPLLRVGATARLTLVVTVNSGTAGQTLINQLAVAAPSGSAPTTVNDPCPDDPARSCAATMITVPPGLAATGTSTSLPGMLGTAAVLLLGGLAFTGAAACQRRRR